MLDLLRIRQWIKNIFVLAPLFFGKDLFRAAAFERGLAAAAAFCLLSSAVYIFNDWRDIEADRHHASKRNRPLASGHVSVPVAFGVFLALLVGVAGIVAVAQLPFLFILLLLLYGFVNLTYSLGLKQIAVLEFFMVSSGFVLRLLSGGAALKIVLSPWIIVATGSIALLLAVGKRRSDMARANDASGKRKPLAGYNLEYMNAVLSVTSATTLVVYILFCVSDYAKNRYGDAAMVTMIPVALGIMRYLQLLIVYDDGDAPTDLLLKDKPLIAIVATFVLYFGALIYLR